MMLMVPEMTDSERIGAFLDHPDIVGLDLSAFSHRDLVNLALQRSPVLSGLDRKPGEIVRAWEAGDDGPLEAAAAELGPTIARRAAALIRSEFEAVAPVISAGAPARIGDIGCGYGIFDLFAARATGASLLLMDIEENDRRHFGFATQGAAYSKLSVARAFLEANGIAGARIETVNPGSGGFASVVPVDLVVSFLSCGFHYPVSAYAAFFRDKIVPGGTGVLDLRRRRAEDQIAELRAFGSVREIGGGTKVVRVAFRRSVE